MGRKLEDREAWEDHLQAYTEPSASILHKFDTMSRAESSVIV